MTYVLGRMHSGRWPSLRAFATDHHAEGIRLQALHCHLNNSGGPVKARKALQPPSNLIRQSDRWITVAPTGLTAPSEQLRVLDVVAGQVTCDADEGWLARDRRASRYLMDETGSIGAMERKNGRPSKGPRAVMIFRMPMPLRARTRVVLGGLGITLTAFLEQIAADDVARPAADRLIPACAELSTDRNGRRGRPSKGPRTTVTLKVSHHLADQIKQRAAALGLSINDYLACLVSRDIRVTRATAGEEMVLDQSA